MWLVCPISKGFVLEKIPPNLKNSKIYPKNPSKFWKIVISENVEGLSTKSHPPLWSALEPNSPFPRLKYFIKNCKKYQYPFHAFWVSWFIWKHHFNLVLNFQTSQKMLKVCVKNFCQIFHQTLKVFASAWFAFLPQKFLSAIHFCCFFRHHQKAFKFSTNKKSGKNTFLLCFPFSAIFKIYHI